MVWAETCQKTDDEVVCHRPKFSIFQQESAPIVQWLGSFLPTSWTGRGPGSNPGRRKHLSFLSVEFWPSDLVVAVSHKLGGSALKPSPFRRNICPLAVMPAKPISGAFLFLSCFFSFYLSSILYKHFLHHFLTIYQPWLIDFICLEYIPLYQIAILPNSQKPSSVKKSYI